MKSYLAFILSMIFIACNNASNQDAVSYVKLPPENSRMFIIKLADSLGEASITLPVRYDTSFTWTHYSDCFGCGKIKYRFQPKSLPIKKESGWIWEDLKDSIERFTIQHSPSFPFRKYNDSISIIHKINWGQRDQISSEYPIGKVRIDTSTEKIGERYFSMVSSVFYDSTKAQYSKKVWMSTTIMSNLIEFRFELLTKEKDSLKDNFIENSKYYLRTIRLSKGM